MSSRGTQRGPVLCAHARGKLKRGERYLPLAEEEREEVACGINGRLLGAAVCSLPLPWRGGQVARVGKEGGEAGGWEERQGTGRFDFGRGVIGLLWRDVIARPPGARACSGPNPDRNPLSASAPTAQATTPVRPTVLPARSVLGTEAVHVPPLAPPRLQRQARPAALLGHAPHPRRPGSAPVASAQRLAQHEPPSHPLAVAASIQEALERAEAAACGALAGGWEGEVQLQGGEEVLGARAGVLHGLHLIQVVGSQGGRRKRTRNSEDPDVWEGEGSRRRLERPG